ncbi:hypothetical protein EG329_008244 [Mollisiaceae sp. DMI_Dod_QoI]|nr:hypothetical protein EG329_008244 [Helotiales sp. DMI_Dod_QoI]
MASRETKYSVRVNLAIERLCIGLAILSTIVLLYSIMQESFLDLPFSIRVPIATYHAIANSATVRSKLYHPNTAVSAIWRKGLISVKKVFFATIVTIIFRSYFLGHLSRFTALGLFICYWNTDIVLSWVVMPDDRAYNLPIHESRSKSHYQSRPSTLISHTTIMEKHLTAKVKRYYISLPVAYLKGLRGQEGRRHSDLVVDRNSVCVRCKANEDRLCGETFQHQTTPPPYEVSFTKNEFVKG